MKKLNIFVLVVIIIFSACKKKKDETSFSYEQKNKPLLIEFSESWCGSCGTYGGPALDAILPLEITTISAMKVMSASTPATMNSSLSDAFSNDYLVTGVPTLFMNADEEANGGGVYASATANYNWANNKAIAFASQPVVAAILLGKYVAGTTIIVTAKIKFYQAQTSGKDFRLAIYVVEDNVISNQNTNTGVISNFNHRNLLRTGNAATYKGEYLNNSTAISLDQEFSKTYSIALNSAWNTSNLKVIGVVWNATGSGKPTVVNSNMIK